VIYFVYDEDTPLLLLTCYGKNVRADLTDAEVRAFAKMTAALKAEYRKAKR
jgi:hypothetical protein